jgi:hypothetical protein
MLLFLLRCKVVRKRNRDWVRGKDTDRNTDRDTDRD